MKTLEKDLHGISTARLQAAVRTAGLQKTIASDLGMSDTQVSRLLNEEAPRVIRLLSHLGLEVVEAGHVEDLRRVLKEVL